MKTTCRLCSNEIEAYSSFTPRICQSCQEQRAKSAAERQEQERLAKAERLKAEWAITCPPAFRNTAQAKLPLPAKFDEVMGWEYGPTGLLLTGPTGAGKSRCAWKLLEREYLADRAVIVTADPFKLMPYPSWLMSEQGKAMELLADLSGDDSMLPKDIFYQKRSKGHILLLDDIFKSRLSPSIEELLYTAIARRCDLGLPVIVTTNDTGASLEARLSPDRGAPLVRRLREFCRVIAFV